MQPLTSLNGIATKPGKKFTAGTVNFIRNNAGKLSASKIGKILHRSEKSVQRKAEKLGISLRVK